MYCVLYQDFVVGVYKYKKDAIKAISKYLSTVPDKHKKEERRLMAIKPITEVSSYSFSFFING